jgi:hypothetical protein
MNPKSVVGNLIKEYLVGIMYQKGVDTVRMLSDSRMDSFLPMTILEPLVAPPYVRTFSFFLLFFFNVLKCNSVVVTVAGLHRGPKNGYSSVQDEWLHDGPWQQNHSQRGNKKDSARRCCCCLSCLGENGGREKESDLDDDKLRQSLFLLIMDEKWETSK